MSNPRRMLAHGIMVFIVLACFVAQVQGQAGLPPSAKCFMCEHDPRAEMEREVRRHIWALMNTDWFKRNTFDITTGSIYLNVDNYLQLQQPRNFVRERLTTTYYQLGNQATYEVGMGPVGFTFHGAIVRMIDGRKLTTTGTEGGDTTPGTSCSNPFNFLRAASGWATETGIDTLTLNENPINGSLPIYSQAWLKGYLTRQVVQTHVEDEPDICKDLPARYVYRYRYHAPDGSTVAFIARPEEVPLQSGWRSDVCDGRPPLVPEEPNFYLSTDGNASLDTTNRCRPVIRWADGSIEEFSRATDESTPMLRSESKHLETLIAEPYDLPTCTAADFARDLHITDRNGNVTTFPSAVAPNTAVMIDSEGRRTVVTYGPGESNGFTRLLSVDLPSIGNAPPHRYTVQWRTKVVDFAQALPDVTCREVSEGTVKPCSDPTRRGDFIPNPDVIDLVDSITIPDGRSYAFEYGPWGNLTRVTEPGGAVRDWIYGGSANLDYARAATPLFNRLEQSRCLGFTWSGEAVKMQARGLIEARIYPNGLVNADGSPAVFHPTKYNYALRKLTDPNCRFDEVGAGFGRPGCSQVWKTTTLPDGTITKTASTAEPLPASFSGEDDQLALNVDTHGTLLAEEAWSAEPLSGGRLLTGTYFGDLESGDIWNDGDAVLIRASPYAIFGNVRPRRIVSVRDGLTTTTNFVYGNSIDINPAPDVITKRSSGKATATCTFEGRVLPSQTQVNDVCTLLAPGNPLLKTETTYQHYFNPASFTGPNLLNLELTTRAFGPNTARTGFSTLSLTEQTSAYDEFPVSPTGLPSSVLNTSVGSIAGSPRGNVTTSQQRVDSGRSVSVKTRYFDDGSVRLVTDARGFTTTHAPQFSLCSPGGTLTSKVTNALSQALTTVSDCMSGLPLRTTDPNGHNSYVQYDRLARAVEAAGPGDVLTALETTGANAYTRDPTPGTPTGPGAQPGDALVTSWTEYRDLGIRERERLVTHQRDGSPGGRITKSFTDGLNRTVQTRIEVDPAKTGFAEVVTTTEYDGLGRVTASFIPCYAAASDIKTDHCGTAKVSTQYDALGRETSVIAPKDRVLSHEYLNENGLWLKKTVDRRGFTTKTFSDLLGHMVKVDRQSPLCSDGYCTTTMTYDAVGRLLTQQDESGKPIISTYDDLGRRKTMSDPDMGGNEGKLWSYDYDDNGNLKKQTDPKGQTISFVYDALNRITLKDLPPLSPAVEPRPEDAGPEDVTYFYDGKGPSPPVVVSNPVPAITAVTPSTATAGGAPFTLTVDGSNFVSGAVVNFNAQPRQTTFVSATRLTAQITASDIQTAGSKPVVVTNPLPGGGVSNGATFTVSSPTPPSIASVTPTVVTEGAGPFTLVVRGGNFAPGSLVRFNGQDRQSVFINATEIRASILSTDVQTPGSRAVVVVNPGPIVSNQTSFLVNRRPSMNLESPRNGTTFRTVPATVTFTSTVVDDTDGAVVSYYIDNALVGSSSTPPSYTVTATNVPAGDHKVSASVTDRHAASAAAPGRFSIWVGPPPPSPGRYNVALGANGGLATASSTGSVHRVAAINDGDRRGPGVGGIWADATPDVYPDWVQIDFNGQKIIDEVALFSLQNNAYTSTVEPTPTMTGSQYVVTSLTVQMWGNRGWQGVDGFSSSTVVTGNNLIWKRVTFAPIATTRVRVTINATPDNYSQIPEIEVYGVDGPFNVALSRNGGVARASSTNAAHSITALNNGDRRGPNVGGIWADATPDVYPDWLQIDFDREKIVNAVTLYSLQDNAYTSNVEPDSKMTGTRFVARNYVVQYWTSGGWVTPSSGTVAGNNLIVSGVTFADVATTKVRVTISSTPDNYTQIPEIEVWGRDRFNVAAVSNGGVVTASSTASVHSTSNLNDSNRRGPNIWGDNTPFAYPDWIQVNFAGMKTINEVAIFSMQDGYPNVVEPTLEMTGTRFVAQDFEVQFWNGAWTTIPGSAVTGSNKVWGRIAFPAVTTDRIRILIKKTPDNYSQIVEVEAYQQ